jgi:hypothetical protein
MKAENKEIVHGAVGIAVMTAFLGPFSLLMVPGIVKDYKKAKEDRLVDEAQQALDEKVARAEAEIQRQIRADEEAKQAKLREERRAAERLFAEEVKLEKRKAALRAEITERTRERERLTKIAQDWLDKNRADRLRRKVRLGILPTTNPLLTKGKSNGA